MRLQKGLILFLSKPMDREADAPSGAALELEGQRRAPHPRNLLHKLRYSRVVSEWQISGRERLRVSASWNGRHIRQFSRSRQSAEDNIRPPPKLGCSLRSRDIKSCRHQGRQNCKHPRSEERRVGKE